MKYTLPTDSAARKDYPVADGPLSYFPAAIAGVAHVCKLGNDKHNPGQPLHHARGKSGDHANCIVRHLMDVNDLRAFIERSRSEADVDAPQAVAALLHEVNQLAWRALALAQELHETYGGAPLAPGARLPEPVAVPFVLTAAPPPNCAARPTGDLRGFAPCHKNAGHHDDHGNGSQSWPQAPAAVPSGTAIDAAVDSIIERVTAYPVPPPPTQDRTTWPLVVQDERGTYPAVWSSSLGSWYFNPDSRQDEEGLPKSDPYGVNLPHPTEAEARAAYWRWKDAQPVFPPENAQSPDPC